MDFPINSMVIFYSYVNVYQRVISTQKGCLAENMVVYSYSPYIVIIVSYSYMVFLLHLKHVCFKNASAAIAGL